jgi:hypothetical protein
MARPMTAREKVAVGVVLVLGLIASELAEDWREQPAFAFSREEVVRRNDPELAVLYLDEAHRAEAEALADVLHADLSRLQRELALESLPPVHVALRQTMDPRAVERVELEKRQGVLLRASFTSDALDRDELRAAVIARTLEAATDGRAAYEPYAWARTGFARAFVHADERALAELPVRRALFVARYHAPSIAMLERWQLTEERWGPAAAEGLAYAAFRAIEARAGREKMLAFARALFAPPAPGALAVIDARLDPPLARLERETGLSADSLEEAWRAELAAWRADPRAHAMRAVPRASATVAIEHDGELRSVRWAVRFASPPGSDAVCALVHAAIGPFDAPLAPEAVQREERRCAELAPEGELLVGRYGAGERVLLAIELDDPHLGAPVRLARERLEVP